MVNTAVLVPQSLQSVLTGSFVHEYHHSLIGRGPSSNTRQFKKICCISQIFALPKISISFVYSISMNFLGVRILLLTLVGFILGVS